MEPETNNTKHVGGNLNFPIIYEDNSIRVFKNPSNEIFVENVASGAQMRINARRHDLEFTANGRVEPVRVSNMIGWLISKR